ncbi:MAG: Hsp33 family molecular chaperone HslO [Alteraurantiacibacter sp.]
MSDTDPALETGFDRLLSFTIPDRDCRGRVVRLGPVLDEILAAHDYPPALKLVLGEALVLTTLLGGLLKDQDDQITLQAQAKGGVVSLLVCDYRNGELRGYLDHDPAEFDTLGASPRLSDLFGEGFLAITFDLGEQGKRYQGIVPLDGASLTAALEAYFAQSEQVPTLIRTGLKTGASGNIAGGLLVQHLPGGEEGRERLHARLDHPQWEHVSVLAQSVRADELIQQDLSLEQLVWRLYNQEEAVLTGQGSLVSKGCRCTIEHFEQVLARFSAEDRRDMADDGGVILVDCAFCSRQFPVED